ncbi:TPA: type VI secretion system baseplate subunit TssE [Citrobacter gillenii]
MLTDRVRLSGSLFERLQSGASRQSRRAGIETLRQSIRHNLRNILNTRSGSCNGSPELGITEPDSGVDFRDAMIQAIKDCIERYEPRIEQADVFADVPDPDAPMDFRFHITAWVVFGDLRDVLEFDMSPDSYQHYQVD